MPVPLPGSGQPPNGHPVISYAKWWRSPAVSLEIAQRLLVLTGAMLVAWAFAAGTWRAWKTASGVLDGAVGASLPEDTLLRAMVVGAPFYVLGALGAVVLILLAAALIGGAFGFLFGIPRMEPGQVVIAPRANASGTAGSSAATPQPAAAAPQPAAEAQEARPAPAQRIPFRPSPALNEIADWLTKIIVGLGLVQARDIGTGFRDIMFWLLGNAGLDRFPLAGAVVPACMIGGLIGGFLAAYLMTTLVIGPEIADAADALDPEREALKRKAEADSILLAAAREAAARAEQDRASSERRQREIAEEAARVDRLRREAAARLLVVREWRPVEVQALLADTATGTPPVSTEARAFADRDLDPAWSVDERQAWAKINIALGRLDRGFEAYREATETA